MVAQEAKAGANTGPQATVRTLNAVFDQAEATLARTDTLEGVAMMYTTADKRCWTFRAKCCVAARDMKTGYHDDSIGRFAELVGMSRRNAAALIEDYELYGCDQSGKRFPDCDEAEDTEPLPRSVYRVANENTPDTAAAITALDTYRERKEAGEPPSVREFAAELKTKHAKPVPVVKEVPFTGTGATEDEEVGDTEAADDFNLTEQRRAFPASPTPSPANLSQSACLVMPLRIPIVVSTTQNTATGPA